MWHDSRSEERLFDKLLSPGSATLDGRGIAYSGTGYAVADPDLTAVGLTTKGQVALWLGSWAVSDALSRGRYVGKWTDPETLVTEINVTDIYGSKDRAVKIARIRSQKSIGWIVDGIYQGDLEV